LTLRSNNDIDRYAVTTNEEVFKMAKTPAQRQAAYRARRNDGEGDRRLNTWISVSAHYALERLATHNNVARREMLERLLCAADDTILDGLEPDSPEMKAYMLRSNKAM